MVIGGQAVLIYGEPRLTKDIDITLGIGIDQYERVFSFVKSLKLKLLPDDPDAFIKKTMVLPVLDEKSGIRVDLIFSYSLFEHEAIKRAKTIYLDKTGIKYATLEDVIIHKMIAGRPRDLEDVKSIILKNPDYDGSYIIKWLNEFDKSINSNTSDGFSKIIKSIT